MKKLLLIGIALLNFGHASAQSINFDDLIGDLSPVNNSYKGLNWNDGSLTGVVDVNPYLSPGVDYTGIQDNALFNAYGYQAANTVILSASNGERFDFISAYWYAGMTGDVDIQFEAYDDENKLFSSTIYTLNTSSVSLIYLNWLGINTLHIISSPAVWIADNFEVNTYPSEVPLPSAFWLLGSALLAFGMRRRTI